MLFYHLMWQNLLKVSSIVIILIVTFYLIRLFICIAFSSFTLEFNALQLQTIIKYQLKNKYLDEVHWDAIQIQAEVIVFKLR